MQSCISTFKKMMIEDSGAAAVEYVVMAAALTFALVPGFYYVSSAMQVKFQFILDFVLGTSS
jgi:Flp pilus assembly pilin Flp